MIKAQQEPKPPFPKQRQTPHGKQAIMTPQPRTKNSQYKGSGKLKGKVAVISGGDSGIGQATAVLFAREGADVAILYLDSHDDAEHTHRLVETEGRLCMTLAGDIGDEKFCEKAIQEIMLRFGKIDILVNNAAEQYPQEDIQKITKKQLERTFRTNIFSYFYLTREALKHLSPGSSIINTTSVTAYRGSEHLLDYSSTKGAIVSFTRSLSQMLVKKEIRVNAVAPGPVWTPLIVSTFPVDQSAHFGEDSPMGRPAQPEEIAPCYVFLASADSSYMTGQVLHPNGGEVVNG